MELRISFLFSKYFLDLSLQFMLNI